MTIEKTAELLLIQAIRERATDIHIAPSRRDYSIQFRVRGSLAEIKRIPPIAGDRLISHMKFLASMDIGERRRPQSGSLQIPVLNRHASMRLSTLPTIHSKESMAIRLLPSTKIHSYGQITLFKNDNDRLLSLARNSHGLLLFTGPTGSGKSTAMYTFADYCTSSLERKVVTIEDPVEVRNDAFVQLQVNEKAGVTYSTGLKAILRHDPEIILIGEIRDAETAAIAVRAAMTGHFVLSSLHTRNAAGAVYRLMEFGVSRQEISQSLIGITGQRLVSLRCPICGPECHLYCRFGGLPKRAGIFEILHGEDLEKLLAGPSGKEARLSQEPIAKMIRKGIALGYISEKEYIHPPSGKIQAAEPEGPGRVPAPAFGNA